MSLIQKGILEPVPEQARYLFFTMVPGGDFTKALVNLRKFIDGKTTVVGIGNWLVTALNREVPGLRSFPAFSKTDINMSATPAALWCWIRGNDRGELFHQTHDIAGSVSPALQLFRVVDAFRYRSGFDLFGYEDGTENPEGTDAVNAAVASNLGLGLDGGSYVAVQQWVHDFSRFRGLDPSRQDDVIGRRRDDNSELPLASQSAHVKRTAQESFSPPAFIVRRSMPWIEDQQGGLMFVGFGRTFDPFEALLDRMTGTEDGITDALFTFTRPVSGDYFWCPPMESGRLDLRALGLP